MSAGHPDLGPELRQFAQAILDRLDPALRAAGARGASGGCQQVWCPVCALAALVTGEQHPLLMVIAEHSAALLTVIRAMVADPAAAAPAAAGPTPAPPPPEGNGSGPPPGTGPRDSGGRYQDIPIVHIPVAGEPAAPGAD